MPRTRLKRSAVKRPAQRVAPVSSHRWLAYFFLLINTVCWGSLLVVAKPALEITSPASLLLGRFLAVALPTIPIAVHLIRSTKITLNQIAQVCAVEFLGTGVAIALLYVGLETTSSLEANIIANLSPLFITFTSLVFLHEKQQRHEWLGMAIAFAGTLGMIFLPNVMSEAVNTSTIWGNLLVLLHSICVGFYFVAGKKVFQGVSKLLVAILGSYVGVVTFFTMLVLQTGGVRSAVEIFARDISTPLVGNTIIYLAFIGTIIGLTAYIKGQELIEASEASLFFYLQPLVYIPLSFFMLQETVSLLQIVLLGVIGTGVFIAEKRS